MKVKKVFSLLLAFAMAMTVGVAAGCDNDDGGDNTDNPVQLASPVISLSDNVISWGAVEHADNYVVKEGTTTVSTQSGLSYSIAKTEAGSYTYTVIATSTDEKYTDSAASNSVTYTVQDSSTGGEVTPEPLGKPEISLSGNVISWSAVEHADGYKVKRSAIHEITGGYTVSTGIVSTQSGLSYTIAVDTLDKEADYYEFTVIATSTDEKYTDSAESNTVRYTVSPQGSGETSTKLTGKIYVVGDSTVCAFSDPYYIPRYGYGTQLHNYFNCDENQIVNLALSGRSSWSFTFEDNYTKLSQITAGDYLIIGFGHNDQKDDIYTNPNLPTDSTETVNGVINKETKSHFASFKRSLYENYIKVAEDAGATAILCTPIVRLNNKNDYSGNSAHVRTESDGKKNPGGDWAQAIRNLGQEKGVTVVDLTALTKSDYTAKGYDEASKYHAATGAKWTDDSKTAMTPTGLDGTHTNLYGAHMNAYYIANALKSSTNSIAKHVKTDIEKPTYEKYYAAGISADYVPADYASFNPSTSPTSALGSLKAEGWYTTVFGTMGKGASTSNYQVIQNTTQDGSLSITVKDINSGTKILDDGEGLVCAFTQLASNATFKISAEVTIDSYVDHNQSAFGIMLRDDIYIDGRNIENLGNYAAAGVYGKPAAANILYTRVKGALTPVNKGQTLDITKTHTLSIERSGKTVTVTFDELSQQYPDFDVCVKDADYMYICLYLIRGTSVTFNNVNLQITGTSEA